MAPLPTLQAEVQEQPATSAKGQMSTPAKTQVPTSARAQGPAPVNCLILDAGPLITNTPSISTLLARAEQLYTVPNVVAEIRDETARSRLETTILPFLIVRSPSSKSLATVREFAQRSGDLAVLSEPDLAVLALAYELECERNHGDWRLRASPGQKRLNGAPPPSLLAMNAAATPADQAGNHASSISEARPDHSSKCNSTQVHLPTDKDSLKKTDNIVSSDALKTENALPSTAAGEGILGTQELTIELHSMQLKEVPHPDEIRSNHDGKNDQDVAGSNDSNEATEGFIEEDASHSKSLESSVGEGEDSDSDSAASSGWITPSNHRRRLAGGENQSTDGKAHKIIQVATITNDYALQNVLLLMNLNLLSVHGSLPPITRLRSYVYRCHACFYVRRPNADANPSEKTIGSSDGGKPAFCPRCSGANTLTRVTTTTRADTGKLTLHLKRNMEWHHRGERYSVPKPVAGSSSGKHRPRRTKGQSQGGQGGWGRSLILAPDQKEYTRAQAEVDRLQRQQARELAGADASEWWERRGVSGGFSAGSQGPAAVRVGAGRNVNAKNRR